MFRGWQSWRRRVLLILTKVFFRGKCKYVNRTSIRGIVNIATRHRISMATHLSANKASHKDQQKTLNVFPQRKWNKSIA